MRTHSSSARPAWPMKRCCPRIFHSWAGRPVVRALPPSSEWRFHRDIFKSRSDVAAIVHTHSRFATALACNGRGIPAFHYMWPSWRRGYPLRAYRPSVRRRSRMRHRRARRSPCLPAGQSWPHRRGADVPAALSLAGEVENLAAQYCAALDIVSRVSSMRPK